MAGAASICGLGASRPRAASIVAENAAAKLTASWPNCPLIYWGFPSIICAVGGSFAVMAAEARLPLVECKKLVAQCGSKF